MARQRNKNNKNSQRDGSKNYRSSAARGRSASRDKASDLPNVSREYSKASDAAVSAKHYSRTNPAEWYIPDKILLDNVASIPFTNAIGAKLDFNQYGNELNDNAIPGIMAITIGNTIGQTDTETAPVNMAYRNLWAYLGQANSRNKTYDSTALGMYILSMDAAHSCLAWMRRIYGCIQLTNVQSRYVPRSLLIAMGIDYDDVTANMAQFRYMINNYATRLSQLVVPVNSSLTRRHMWLYEGIYGDHGIGKTQLYLFKPAGFHEYHVTADGRAELKYRLLPYNFPSNRNHLLTYLEIRNAAAYVLDSILNRFGEQDFDTISADILKAFGENAVYRAQLMPEDYTVMPVYDEHVLWQITNATCAMNRSELYNEQYDGFLPALRIHEAVSDNTSVIETAFQKSLPTHGANADVVDRLINIPKDLPTPEDVIDATRLTVQGLVVNNDKIWFFAVGSEIPLYANTYRFHFDANGNWVIHQGDDITYRYSTQFPEENPASDPNDSLDWTDVLSVTTAQGAVYTPLNPSGTDYNAKNVSATTTSVTIPSPDSVEINYEAFASILDTMNSKLQTAVNHAVNALSELAEFSTFDWHPAIWYNGMTNNHSYSHAITESGDRVLATVTDNVDVNSRYAHSLFTDITNVSTIKMQNLVNIHEVALQAQFGLTIFGKSTV